MYRLLKRFTPLLLICTGIILSTSLSADNHSQEMLSETWTLSPKEGASKDFQNAMKTHLKYRHDMQDPRRWTFYSPVLGKNLDTLAVRSFGFGWKDMDSYRDWDKQSDLQKHFAEHVEPHVGHYGHYLSLLDMKNSHWGPEVEYKYVGVNTYVIKLGQASAVEKDKKLMSDAAKAQNWPYHWAWSNTIGGRGELQLAVPYKNYAAMATPETKFAEVLAKHLGSEEKAKEMFERWASHFESVTYNIWAKRDDLMPEK